MASVLNRLDWLLWKQRDVVNQIREVKEKAEKGEQINHLGYLPVDITPQDLLNIHKERYIILRTLEECSVEQVDLWLKNTENRIKDSCKIHDGCNECYLTKIEIEILKEYKNQC